MHFGSSEEGGGSTSGRIRAALEFSFLNSAADANGNAYLFIGRIRHRCFRLMSHS